jgi:hypothetical protein
MPAVGVVQAKQRSKWALVAKGVLTCPEDAACQALINIV